MNLSRHTKITDALDYASGTSSRNGATLDMQGWDGVLMIAKFATIASGSVGDVHAEQGAASNLSDAADLAGTAQTVADDDDNQFFVIDLYRPLKRYVRMVVTKDASNACAEIAFYLQYTGRKLPVTSMGADNYELHVSPSEGTK